MWYIFKLAKHFSSATGSLINMDKSWGLWLGAWRERTDSPYNLKWTNDQRKILGVMFGGKLAKQSSWDKIKNKVRTATHVERDRQIGYTERAQYVNCILAAKVWYVGSIIDCPSNVVENIQRSLFSFFWSFKTSFISYNSLYLNTAEGGFKIINVKVKLQALAVKQFCSIFTSNAKWKEFAIYWMANDLKKFDPVFGSNSRPKKFIPFYTCFYKTAYFYFKLVMKLGKIDKEGISTLTTKHIYKILLKYELRFHTPKIFSLFPRINFSELFITVHHPFIDSHIRDISWRVMNHTIPTCDLLVKRKICRIDKCSMCELKETVSHLFF